MQGKWKNIFNFQIETEEKLLKTLLKISSYPSPQDTFNRDHLSEETQQPQREVKSLLVSEGNFLCLSHSCVFFSMEICEVENFYIFILFQHRQKYDIIFHDIAFYAFLLAPELEKSFISFFNAWQI